MQVVNLSHLDSVSLLLLTRVFWAGRLNCGARLLAAVVWRMGEFRSENSLRREPFERYLPEISLKLAGKELRRCTHRNLFDAYPFVPQPLPAAESNTSRRTPLCTTTVCAHLYERARKYFVERSSVRSARLFFISLIRPTTRTSLLCRSPQQPIEAFVEK